MRASTMAALGLSALVAAFLLSLILPGQRHFAWAVLALGMALVALGVILDARSAGGPLASRRRRFGLGATVEICLFLGIVVAVNAIGLSIYHRFDFTGLAQFTLTSQTQDVLGNLDTPVEVVSFFTPGATVPVKNYAESLLGEYRRHTDRITLRAVDPDLNPDQARAYGVDQLGSVLGVLVFTGDAGRKRVFGPEVTGEAEHAFTSAILEVTGERQKEVLFVTGHGEGSIELELDAARAGLRDNLFDVGEVDLLQGEGIPPDAASLVIAGPRRQFSPTEVETVREYLQAGGRMLVLLDPGSFGGLQPLLEEWGIGLQDGYIVDPESHLAESVSTPLVPRTRNAIGLPGVYFPGATAVLPRPGLPEGHEISPLVWSSRASWLETSGRPEAVPDFDAGTDRQGPLAIGALLSVGAAALENAEQEMRLAVIGDSDFAGNQHFGSANNADLFVAVVNWLTEGTRFVSVERKPLSVRRLVLTPEAARLLHATSIGLLPLVLVLTGVLLWWWRR